MFFDEHSLHLKYQEMASKTMYLATVWEIGNTCDTSPHLCTTPDLSLKTWEIDGVSTASKPKEKLIKVAIVE